MKNFTSFSARKILAQSLILPKIDFNDYVYSPLTQCQLKKLAFKAINNRNWPEINKLEIQNSTRTLRSSSETRIRPSMIPNTFQDTAASSFNALPSDIKQQTNFNKFCADVKTFLMKKAKDSHN